MTILHTLGMAVLVTAMFLAFFTAFALVCMVLLRIPAWYCTAMEYAAYYLERGYAHVAVHKERIRSNREV